MTLINIRADDITNHVSMYSTVSLQSLEIDTELIMLSLNEQALRAAEVECDIDVNNDLTLDITVPELDELRDDYDHLEKEYRILSTTKKDLEFQLENTIEQLESIKKSRWYKLFWGK